MQDDEVPFKQKPRWPIAPVPAMGGVFLGGLVGAAQPTSSIMMTSLEVMIHTVVGAGLGLVVGGLVGLSIVGGLRR